MSKKLKPQKFAVVTHPRMDHSGAEASLLISILSQGDPARVAMAAIHDDDLCERIHCGEFDTIVALGGDGTMLRAARLAAPLGLPVLGINMGNFGFLMEIQRGNWQSLLPKFLRGDYSIEERSMLSSHLMHAGKCSGEWEALNDVVVSRGQYVRPIHLQASINGHELASYSADGLIIATPTGSTAYALAVGGPILPPEMRNTLIVPIAPHRSLEHAVVLPEGTAVNITVRTNHQAVVSVDGQDPHPVENGDSISIETSRHTARFIRLHEPAFFYRNLINSLVRNSYPESVS